VSWSAHALPAQGNRVNVAEAGFSPRVMVGARAAGAGQSGERRRGRPFPPCHGRRRPATHDFARIGAKKSWVAGLTLTRVLARPAMTREKPSPDCPGREKASVGALPVGHDRTGCRQFHRIRLFNRDPVDLDFVQMQTTSAAQPQQQETAIQVRRRGYDQW
jgi:hypothetical protein